MIEWLNDNAGVLTLGFVVLTFLSLLETRAARIATTASAHVSFRPDIDRSAGTSLRLRLRNHGPAVAAGVQMRMQWFEGDEERSPLRRMTEPVLGVGDERVYIPGILLSEPKPMSEMAGLVLRVEWSWLDERRWFGVFWLNRRTRKTLSLDLEEFVASVHGGPLMLERDTLAEEVREVGNQLRKMNDRATVRGMRDWQPMDINARAHFEHVRLTTWFMVQRELWKARWKVWTRRP